MKTSVVAIEENPQKENTKAKKTEEKTFKR